MGRGSRHKTKGQIWLHRGPQHWVIGTARWQQKKRNCGLTKNDFSAQFLFLPSVPDELARFFPELTTVKIKIDFVSQICREKNERDSQQIILKKYFFPKILAFFTPNKS
jgi:hypothetical protein